MYQRFYSLKNWYTFTPFTGTLSRHFTEEGEFRQIFGDLSQIKLNDVISRIKSMAQLFQTTSIWKELTHNEKTFFLNIRNLRADLITAEMPFKEAYKIIVQKIGLRLLTDKEKKKNKTTYNRQFIALLNGLFYDHFQVELNKKLQEELKKYVEESEYQNVVDISENDNSEKYVNIPIKVKNVKKGREIDLEQDHYAILTYYFQKGRIFLNGPNISDVSASKAVQILSGYHYDNIRKKLGSLDFTNNQKVVVKEKLQEIIGLINSDLTKR